ncbi:MAG: polysaccharide pyruvyl transferase family protein [Faecousia sp.]
MKACSTNQTIATHTYMNSDNYGSVFQTYALHYLLKKMGYEAYVIDYKKKEVAQLYQIFKPNTSRFNMMTNCYHALHYGQLKEKQQRFEDFRAKHITKTEQQYHTHQQLIDMPPKADCYICGSDQVWNTQIVDFDDSYLLDFVKCRKKISYSASGIQATTPEEEISKITSALKGFDAVSVRENIGKKRIEENSGIPVFQALDPVLLLSKSEWRQLFQNKERTYPTKDRYMFCYFAGGVSDDFDKYTAKLAKEHGLKRVLIMPEWRNALRTGKKYYGAGPIEFLELLDSAAIVCTNSFHGTALSILFNKPFLVGLHKPFSEDRIKTLLELCRLTDREIDSRNYQNGKSVFNVDFSHANAVLNEERGKSIEWLQREIEKK